jgi:hypothetical protein
MIATKPSANIENKEPYFADYLTSGIKFKFGPFSNN